MEVSLLNVAQAAAAAIFRRNAPFVICESGAQQILKILQQKMMPNQHSNDVIKSKTKQKI